MKNELNDDSVRRLFRETLDTETSKDFSAGVMDEINLLRVTHKAGSPDPAVMLIFLVFMGLLGASLLLPSNQTISSTANYFEDIIFLIKKVGLTFSRFQNYITGLALLLLINYSFEYFMKRMANTH